VELNDIEKLFGKFIGNPVNINGLELTLSAGPSDVDGYCLFNFDINNNDDVSFLNEVVKEEIIEIIADFSKYVPLKIYPHINFGETPYYFSEDLNLRIKNFFGGIKSIWYGDGFHPIVIDGESIGFDVEVIDDELILTNKFKVYETYVNGVKVDDTKSVSINYKIRTMANSRFWESENIYIGLDSVLNDYPLLNKGWITQSYVTTFIS
jgi:hypothetical protein